MPSITRVAHRFKSDACFAAYVARQLGNFFPDEASRDEGMLLDHMAASLEKLGPILDRVRSFQPGFFNHLNSLQYATFIYILAREIWLNEGDNDTSERLFLLNKALNSLDIYYRVNLPKVFFISHGSGTVLGNVTFGNNLVVFQNVTVGRLGERTPVIGENVILFPNSLVLGTSIIGDNSIVAAGTIVNDTEVPENSIAFSSGSQTIVKRRRADYLSLYFR